MQISLQETGLYRCLTQERTAPAAYSKATESLLQPEQCGWSMQACAYIMPVTDSCTRVAPGCMDTFSSSHLLLLSPDCFTGELLHRWKWWLWAKPSGFNLWLFRSASGGSLSAPLCLLYPSFISLTQVSHVFWHEHTGCHRGLGRWVVDEDESRQLCTVPFIFQRGVFTAVFFMVEISVLLGSLLTLPWFVWAVNCSVQYRTCQTCKPRGVTHCPRCTPI